MRKHLTWFVPLLLLLPTTTAAQGVVLEAAAYKARQNALLAPQVETRAPLSEWRQDETFESVEECQMYPDEWFDVKRHLADSWLKNEPTAHAEAYKFNLWRGERHDAQAARVA
jgi:hypothetical protein